MAEYKEEVIISASDWKGREVLLLYKRLHVLESFCKKLDLAYKDISNDLIETNHKYKDVKQLNLLLSKKIDLHDKEIKLSYRRINNILENINKYLIKEK